MRKLLREANAPRGSFRISHLVLGISYFLALSLRKHLEPKPAIFASQPPPWPRCRIPHVRTSVFRPTSR